MEVAPLNLFDKQTARVLFTTLLFVLGLLFLYFAWRAVLAFVFAVFFAYLLEAPVARLQKLLHGSRNGAIAIVYAIFLGSLVIVLSMAAPPVVQEAQKLMQQTPEWSRQISSGQIVQQVGTQHGWSQETAERIQSFLMNHRQEVISAAQALVLHAVDTIQSMWWLLLVPILAIFFLKDGAQFGDAIINSVENARNRTLVAAAVKSMNMMLGDFLRAQLLLSLLAVVVITLVLRLLNVPYAFALGPAAGALEFIPVAGPVIGGLVVMGVGFVAGSKHLLVVFIFLLVWRGIQDYVTSPRILGDKLALHPLAVLFGILAGGEVAGVIGVFLSIPILATLRILWHTWDIARKQTAESKLAAAK
ncbi:MAG TPA: AI-2E family transporter [Alphaproteobacteria bacterium]|nr:AI-2E family transporter [Alphaproteobacteria bacterium]